jgi:hypothetical protein
MMRQITGSVLALALGFGSLYCPAQPCARSGFV